MATTGTKRKLSDIDSPNEQGQNKRPTLALGHGRDDHNLPYPLTDGSTARNPKPVAFQQPLPLVTFSYNSSRVLEFNDSSLRYYVDPPAGADLGYGYDRWIRRPEEKGRIDGLLKAWLKAKEKLPEGNMKGGVISWRGVITK